MVIVYGHAAPHPKTKAGKFFWHVVFPSFIFSLTIAAIIETGLKFLGYHVELTPIFFVVFLLYFLYCYFFMRKIIDRKER